MEKAFLNHDFLNRKVKIPLRILLDVQQLSPDELMHYKSSGNISISDPLYLLEAGGEILGKGKITEKEGKVHFQLLQKAQEEKQ